MKYSIHPDAEAELGDAAVYYVAHASRAIAAAFLAEFERVRDLLVENQQRAHMAMMVCVSTTSTASRTQSCTKKMR